MFSLTERDLTLILAGKLIYELIFVYLFIVYVITLSETQTAENRMRGLLTNHDFQKIRKEAAVA
jgi:hypothetical protein